MDEKEAAHTAADQAIDELKHKTRQRRRVERDTLLGVGGHEELLRRYRKGSRLTDAHSRRLGKQLLKVSRWAAMERGLREVGYPDVVIEEIMSTLMGEFRKSEKAGQAQWKKIREAVLRRRAAADSFAKAEEVEASVMKSYVEQFGGEHVKCWVTRQYGTQSSE
jgi:hypothetical protein